MVNSRAIEDLRADVAENCRIWKERCFAEGLNVLITQTLRDDEYQSTLYEQGRTKPGSIITNSKVTTFHGKGLAFDFCKNVKGHEYDDLFFFQKAAEIAKEIGFTWGGDWKSFTDRPHLQWDEHGKYTGDMVRNGKMPKEMEEYMDQANFNKMMDNYLAEKRKESQPENWAKKDWEQAKHEGITDGSAPRAMITRQATEPPS